MNIGSGARCRNSSQGSLKSQGEAARTLLTPSPVESSSVTLGKKVVMNKFRSVSEVSHSPTATTCSECPAQRIPKTQLGPSVPIPPISAFRVSPLGAVRDTSKPWALSLSGEDTTAVMGWGSPPHRLQPTLSQGSQRSPPQHPDLQAA